MILENQTITNRQAVIDELNTIASRSLSEVLETDNYAGTNSIRMGSGAIVSEDSSNQIVISNDVVNCITSNFKIGNSGTTHFYHSLVSTTNNTPTTIFELTQSMMEGAVKGPVYLEVIISGYSYAESPDYPRVIHTKLFASFDYFEKDDKTYEFTKNSTTGVIINRSNFSGGATGDITTDGSKIIVSVTGETSKNIDWMVKVESSWNDLG